MKQITSSLPKQPLLQSQKNSYRSMRSVFMGDDVEGAWNTCDKGGRNEGRLFNDNLIEIWKWL